MAKAKARELIHVRTITIMPSAKDPDDLVLTGHGFSAGACFLAMQRVLLAYGIRIKRAPRAIATYPRKLKVEVLELASDDGRTSVQLIREHWRYRLTFERTSDPALGYVYMDRLQGGGGWDSQTWVPKRAVLYELFGLPRRYAHGTVRFLRLSEVVQPIGVGSSLGGPRARA